MKITLVQRISKSINSYKSAFYDTNLAINVVSWFQELYPSVLFRYLVDVKTLVRFYLKPLFCLPANLTFRLPTSLVFVSIQILDDCLQSDVFDRHTRLHLQLQYLHIVLHRHIDSDAVLSLLASLSH